MCYELYLKHSVIHLWNRDEESEVTTLISLIIGRDLAQKQTHLSEECKINLLQPIKLIQQTSGEDMGLQQLDAS